MDLIAVTVLLFVSLGFNAYQASIIKKLNKSPQALEVRKLFFELMSGRHGVFGVYRIDTEDLMIRSPRAPK